MKNVIKAENYTLEHFQVQILYYHDQLTIDSKLL